MALALEEFRAVEGKVVLEIGSGSGELSIRLAERGARRVVGVDAAGEMVRVARAHAKRRGMDDRCEFIQADFSTHDFRAEKFDYVVALGVFDYVPDAPVFLSRMWRHNRERLVISLPHAVPPRSWLRTAWHGWHGNRLHYFTTAEVRALASGLSPADLRVHAIPGSDRTDVLACDVAKAVGTERLAATATGGADR
jgi:ubiquinone/menaquinone biosynthesis C-methylase UbiE